MREMNLIKTEPNGHTKPTNSVIRSTAREETPLPAANNGNSLHEVLATVVTPSGAWLSTLSKAIGPAEAEIIFKERVTSRED